MSDASLSQQLKIKVPRVNVSSFADFFLNYQRTISYQTTTISPESFSSFQDEEMTTPSGELRVEGVRFTDNDLKTILELSRKNQTEDGT
jgi:hypothetical protein